jgi:hypothetical protein
VSTRDSLLLALLAPGSVEAAAGAIQETIFREHGLVSAIALPPIVPVAFLDAGPTRGFLDSLDRAVHAPYRFRTTSVLRSEGALFLGLDTGGVWAALRSACAALVGVPEGRRLFPTAEGFFLGCLEAGEAKRQGVLPEPAAMSFSSSTLAVMRITTPARGYRWWRDVSCEIEEERPLRGKRT